MAAGFAVPFLVAGLAIDDSFYRTTRAEWQQELDEIILHFRPATRQNTNYKYSQDGLLLGQNVSSFNFISGTSTFEPGT